MDLKDITKSLLTTANVKAISGQSGATQTQVKSVLTSALPALLSGKKTSASEISKETGVSKAKTNGILSAAAPLLGGLLGGGKEEEKPSGTAALLGGLLGSVNIGSLASGLFSLVSSNDDDEEEEEEEEEKPKPKPKKPAAKKPASGKKTDSKKDDGKKKTDSKKKTDGKKKTGSKKEEKKDSSPLDAVTGLLGGLLK